MNKHELEQLAELRIKEAAHLLAAGCYQGAYYLAGYSLECLLKARIAKRVKQHDFPDKKLANDSHIHDLTKLCIAAEMKPDLNLTEQEDEDFKLNWAVAKEWNVESRYNVNIDKQRAEDLFNAITDSNSGVMPWLKKFL
jgi:hypothetical protein